MTLPIFAPPARTIPVCVRLTLELRDRWLRLLTVEALHAWIDAFDSLTDAEASVYCRCVR